MLVDSLINLLDISYYNVILYIIIGYLIYYMFSASFMYALFLIIGIILGFYIANKFFKQ
jgi:hypothetical protein